MTLLNVDISDIIQIIIAFILLLTAITTGIFSYLNFINNKKQGKVNITNSIISEERDLTYKINSCKMHKIKSNRERILIQNENDELVFDFYEYIAILLYYKKIDIEICYDYFKNKFLDAYFYFMSSDLFRKPEERFMLYPHLSTLFNSFNLSIKKLDV